MKNIFSIIQIILSLTLIFLVFLQPSESSDTRSNFLSNTNVEKRGWEKIMFNFTIVLLIIFVISSVIQTLI